MALSILLTACGSRIEDTTALVAANPDGDGPVVVIPVCTGERLIGATYWLGEDYSTVDLRQVIPDFAAADMTVDLDMGIAALESGHLAQGAEAGRTDPELAGVSFYELDVVEVETTSHMVRISPGLVGETATVEVYWAYPFGKNDPAVTPVDESAGRDDLVSTCH